MVIIVGSGAGGGLLAMELASANIPVTLIEKGPFIETKDAFKYYDKSDEGVDLLKTTCIGGTTLVSTGNAVRSLEDDFKKLGIDLSNEFNELEDDLNIHELNDSHHGISSNIFIKSANKLNLNPCKMPKAINEEKCIICGNCAFGCPVDAKWTSKDFVEIAEDNGAEILTNSEVIDLIIENDQVKGVKILNNGKKEEIISDLVILSAGAIGSGIILQNAGIKAGEKLFFDSFVTVGGILKDVRLNKEIQMNGLVTGENFILAPHFSTIIYDELKDKNIRSEDIFSIMVKIPDEPTGYIKNNKVFKNNSIKDGKYLAEGCAVAGFILKEAGVDPNTIKSTNIRGAHPGGTAAIGEVVDTNLQTKINGLYVADASVLPKSPGKPPILTILALSKRLSNYIIANY
ncbi:GMC family oxidoreductase N-terminal domain-containing protein [Methanobrevibacter sp. DSM 116169]|uniref:GMC family oxidoreductase N-terminal domain-containing protein n=1 Tax=Methanobrevibacter sp. DSM 116169 TaxID=3242727 RepID=UPI0038FC90E8